MQMAMWEWDSDLQAQITETTGTTFLGSMKACQDVLERCSEEPDGEQTTRWRLSAANAVVRLAKEGRALGLLPTVPPPSRGNGRAEGGATKDGAVDGHGAGQGGGEAGASHGSSGDAADLREWTEIMDARAFGLRFDRGPDGEPIRPAFWRRRFWTRPDGSLGEHGVDDARGRGGYWGRRLPAQDFMDEHLAQTFQDSDGKFRGVPPSPADREEWAALTEAERDWALSDECAALYAEMEARQAELAARKATYEMRQAEEASAWGGFGLVGVAEDGTASDGDDGGGGHEDGRGGGAQTAATSTPTRSTATPIFTPMPMAMVPPPIIVGLPDPEDAKRREKEVAARKRREQAQYEEDLERAKERPRHATW